MDRLSIEVITGVVEWQKEQPHMRHVKIEIDSNSDKVWVYDFSIMAGRYITSLEELPTLREDREREEREQLARLKAKYEEVN